MSAIRLVALCGPRGAGKKTILNSLCKEFALHRIVPHTTRAARQSERDGREYHFVSDAEFDELIDAGQFIWFGQIGPSQRSGTILGEFTKAEHGCIVDIKPDGARVMRERVKKLGGDALLLCMMASPEERRHRVQLREPGIAEHEVERLLREDPVPSDVKQYEDFDRILWNSGDDPVPACKLAKDIVAKFVFAMV